MDNRFIIIKLPLNKDIKTLKGIGPKKAQALNNLGIYTISDLYNYYPREYEDRRVRMSLSKAKEDRKYFFVWKSISRPYVTRAKNMTVSYMYFAEGDFKKIRVVWFNDKFSIRKISYGQTYKFYTKVEYKDGYYQAINPVFEDMQGHNIGGIYSVYRLGRGISHKDLKKFISESLKVFDKNEEILDKSMLDKFELSSKEYAISQVHFPSDLEALLTAKSDLKILNLLRELIYLDYLTKYSRFDQELKLNYDLENILSKITFSLTRDQRKSLEEILSDCKQNQTMNRLLVGDVGSGKTIVAIISMIVFGLNNYQSAMMVPTEILAIQQYEKNRDLIESFGLKVALLTGSVNNKNKIKKDLKDGSIDLVIGTHALIQEDVDFKNLRLVINDEQHRFGVKQRLDLAQKGKEVNYLTMTATPIPRTMSLKLNRILDLSIINELPQGRADVITQIIMENREKLLFEKIIENISDGRQVYVVTNNIDSDDPNSLENLYKRYKNNIKNSRIEKLHGKLNPALKEEVLYKFSKGEIDILISTTVIEVGIDVANANTMVIYNASNFGLSQLHQLRGRVGRGPYLSYCFLMDKDGEINPKLNILEKSQDGFEISQKDYELRGGGKILSLIQHGNNLSEIESLNMSQEDTDRAFMIFDYLKEKEFKGANLEYIKKYFGEDKDIILN